MEFAFSIQNIHDGNGVAISVTGMFIVFTALALITLFIAQMSRFIALLSRFLPPEPEFSSVMVAKKAPVQISDEVAMAIVIAHLAQEGQPQ